MTDYRSLTPLFATDRLAETTAFWTRHFGLRELAAFEGYVELEREDGFNVAFMTPCEGTAAGSGQGLCYCFQVADADAEYARLSDEGCPMSEAPEDRPWGERGFFALDPNGIKIWIGHPLAADPSASATATELTGTGA